MKIIANEVNQVKTLHGSILVVDDWLCEGRAMRYVLNLLPKDVTITTLALFNREGSEFKPEIVGAYIDRDERDLILPYDQFG
jgi:pyrimidine operon attenuation protein/uracil phosphoribosyltransferase